MYITQEFCGKGEGTWPCRKSNQMNIIQPACLNTWIMIILLPVLIKNSLLEEKKSFKKTLKKTPTQIKNKPNQTKQKQTKRKENKTTN